MPKGRGASLVRTPSLIREYLGGTVEFPEDRPEEMAARLTEGDYSSRMNQRIKLGIREISPRYQDPRKHSFLSLVQDDCKVKVAGQPAGR